MRIPFFLTVISIVINILTCGPRHMTLCARVYGQAKKGSKPAKVIYLALDKLFWFDPEHCRQSYLFWRINKRKP